MMARRRRNEREAGFSLIELLVVVVLVTIVGSVVVSAITSGLRTQTRTTVRLDALEELQVATQRISRDIRVARQVVFSTTVPAAEQIGARIVRADQPSLVVYRLTDEPGEQFLEQIEQAGTADQVTRRLVTQVDNDELGVDLLEYLDVDGQPLSCVETVDECRATYLTAQSVVITLARGIEGRDDPLIVSTTVNIRSIRYGSDPS